MGEIVKFEFGPSEITTITDEGGDIWWLAKEVCNVLGLKVKNSVRYLDDDEKREIFIRRLQDRGHGGDTGKRIIINEPGLFSLILRSRKPEAERFKRWVTHEVLPSIRKTGHYGTDPGDVIMRLMSDPAYLRAMLLTYSEKKSGGRLAGSLG